MTEKEGMISVSAESENGAGKLVIEISEDALQALGAEPGDKLVWRVGEDGRVILKKRNQSEDQKI
ncbi:hypothetical protein P3C80_30705 [Pseudomonas aeruginosa]|uniref:hypothetical protein n=1 Tax=Pseudomonas aeruginosa TaxID=287 RepID=UPI0021F1E75D|nr:hypothetical protein [Pseudomonas aeruginosa]MCV6104745.1 hypothetical protein [Pseudomonas aeruginosa]HBO3958497.1 hypothetical protein [Pseudomonas aeruginosa]HCF6076489.1 hypothetical protein [Pseudomonas aeruginosa]HEP8278980.1 hypothetical protein [Pseudomonas aeruginosa]